MEKTQCCEYCGKDVPISLRCSQCKNAVYCNKTCQRSDWIDHKRVCFPEGSKCTRCLETITSENLLHCLVPHPNHMLRDCGCSSVGGATTWRFHCEACGHSFARSTQDRDHNRDIAPITTGPLHCFSGSHTIKPLKIGDNRCVRGDVLNLSVAPDLQNQIDRIPSTMPNLCVLTIQSSGWYDGNITPVLEIPMPKLKTLKLINCAFRKVILTRELTPEIEEIFFQNIPEDCELSVVSPKLKHFSMHYYGPSDNDHWIHEMLETATQLETFDSYKLRVGPLLRFAGNNLRSINLRRAEFLSSLIVYAPHLQHLRLQSCYELMGEISFPDTFPGFPVSARASLSTFDVDTTNSCISRSILDTLASHPRVVWEEPDDEDVGF